MSEKQSKRLFALLVALTLLATSITTSPTQAAAASKTKVGDAYYIVVSDKNTTAEYVKPTKKTCTSATIPKTVKIGKKSYKVTGIAENAFRGCSKLTKVTIGKNVGKIGKKAFFGCKNLKAIKINTTKLTKKSVGTKAFAKINAKVIVTVPQSKRTEYNEILRASGIPSTYVLEWEVVEEEKEEVRDDGTTWQNYVKGQPLPEPESAGFTIGDLSKKNATIIDIDKVAEATYGYYPGSDIKFTAGIEMSMAIYGNWGKEKAKAQAFTECGRCGKYFDTDMMHALHGSLMMGACSGANYLIRSFSEPISYNKWVFTPDDTPCRVVYRFVLPEGLSYKDGSVEIRAMDRRDIPEDAYHVRYSGNELTVTVDDIKSLPYYFPFDKKSYDKDNECFEDEWPKYEGINMGIITPINVLFSTNMNDSTTGINTVSGSITYSYKGNEKTVELGERTIFVPSREASK